MFLLSDRVKGVKNKDDVGFKVFRDRFGFVTFFYLVLERRYFIGFVEYLLRVRLWFSVGDIVVSGVEERFCFRGVRILVGE